MKPMVSSSNGEVKAIWKVLNIVAGLLLAVLVAMSTWTISTVSDNKIKLATIEANRFTSKDGLEVWKAISMMRESIPKEVPPKWWVDAVNKSDANLSNRLDRLESSIEGLKKEVAGLRRLALMIDKEKE